MYPLSQLMHALLDGVDQGTAKAVTIGTSAAAAATWKRITTSLRTRRPSLDLSERVAGGAVRAAGMSRARKWTLRRCSDCCRLARRKNPRPVSRFTETTWPGT